MQDTGEADIGRRFQFPSASSLSYKPKQQNQVSKPIFNPSQIGGPMHQFSQKFSPESSKKPSLPHLPPSPPYSQITLSQLTSQQVGSQDFNSRPSHSRSSSQPPFFSVDYLPPLSPLPNSESPQTSLHKPTSVDVSMAEKDNRRTNVFRGGENLPPRKGQGHRRSNSDIPFRFSTMIPSSPQLMPISSQGNQKPEIRLDRDGNNMVEGPGERKPEGDVVDDMFTEYMNLDNIDALNSSGTEDKDIDSRTSGTKTNGGDSSDNEVQSSLDGNGNGRHGRSKDKESVKWTASGDIAPVNRHFRSVSMDSFVGNMHFGDELPKLPPSPQSQLGQSLNVNSVGENLARFNFDFEPGEFSGPELKKIMADEKLVEIATSDPKRAKRILANRLSAARSKERKMRYISELEHKVQTLQTEATTLSAQVTLLQRDSAALNSQNNELRIRIQAMEQQAQLRDALNEALKLEVQRLRLAAAELNGETHPSNCMGQQFSLNRQMLQLQNQQPSQPNIYQLEQQRQQQKKNQPASVQQNGRVA